MLINMKLYEGLMHFIKTLKPSRICTLPDMTLGTLCRAEERDTSLAIYNNTD